MAHEVPTIRLVPLRGSHAQELFDGLCDERIYEFIDDTPPPSLSWLQDRFAFLAGGAPSSVPQTWLNWAVLNDSNGQALGTVQATIPDSQEPTSIAYTLLRESWGRGHGAEAVRLMLDQLQQCQSIEIAQAEIHELNWRSIRLVETLGFTHADTVAEGDHLERVYRKGLSSELPSV